MNAEHWVDYQNIFGKRYGYDRAVSLEDALLYSEIDQAGRAHNGLDDAYNTAQLIEKLEKNPDYIPCVKSAAKKKEDMLTYSLGDLLGKLFQQTNQMAV